MVKLDVGRFNVPETEKLDLGGAEVLIPRKCYFLAAKLSSLAFGTIGRFKKEPIQVIKDIFDINCLLDLGADLDHMAKDWKHIISEQNRLRNGQFSEEQCAKSVRSILLKCVDADPLPDFFIPQSALGGFVDYLFEGKIIRPELATMAARALLVLANMDNRFYDIEKAALSESENRETLNEAEAILVKKGIIDSKQVRAIKITAPKALIYLRLWSEIEK